MRRKSWAGSDTKRRILVEEMEIQQEFHAESGPLLDIRSLLRTTQEGSPILNNYLEFLFLRARMGGVVGINKGTN